MRTLLIVLVCAAMAGAQEKEKGWSGGRSSTKADCCTDGKAKPWSGYNQGVQWTQPIDDAVAKAKKEGKLLLVFHLVGDMDKEGC
jgi:hypothetical protein